MEFQEIVITKSVARRESTRIRQSAGGINLEEAVLEPAFTHQMLPISVAKKHNLVSLVESGAIPPEYCHYYRNLPSRNNVRDALAEPDLDELTDEE